jgi:hypothetical protein
MTLKHVKREQVPAKKKKKSDRSGPRTPIRLRKQAGDEEAHRVQAVKDTKEVAATLYEGFVSQAGYSEGTWDWQRTPLSIRS